MGREVRMVPVNWAHPVNDMGDYEPLLDGYEDALTAFENDIEEMGLRDALDAHGGGPCSDDYMHPKGDRTHYMMYETTSDGTPLSPAFATPEELAQWLADNAVSAFADRTATYEQWLATIRRGYAISVVWTPSTGVISGVEAEQKS